MRYHLQIADSFWPKKFPHWNEMRDDVKQEHMHRFLEQVRDFLNTRRPATTGRVALMITTFEVNIVPLMPDAEVVLTQLDVPVAAHRACPFAGRGHARCGLQQHQTVMRDFLTLGSTPTSEPCAQVGTDDYATKARIESRVFIDQLLRQFGEPPGLSFFKVKGFPHEFGTYHEVVITFDDENEEAVEFAYNVENNLPAKWDEEALNELRATNYHMSVVRITPSTDAPGLVAMEPAVGYEAMAKAS